MYGLVLGKLKDFVVERHQGEGWEDLLKRSGLRSRIYMHILEYPDEEFAALVQSLSQMSGKTAPVILEEFGEYIVPSLLEMYRLVIDPKWKTLDLLEHTEENIHKVIRLRQPEVKPPQIQCSRSGPGEVVILYGSPRKLCGFAKGMVKGVARYYDEPVAVTETTCMLKADPRCSISVKLVGQRPL
jgi:predicted hydrocarbon binding protein